MGLTLFSCRGGSLVLPDRANLLASREDGGNLVVLPPREVWERSELAPDELTWFAFLVAAAGRAMIDALPQLDRGCVNYWEAGNWALNDAAEPAGEKDPRRHRKMHLHLLGRSRSSASPAWRWGESPVFPRYADRRDWAERFERLDAGECRRVVAATESLLRSRYGARDADLTRWAPCGGCGYPMPAGVACPECRPR